MFDLAKRPEYLSGKTNLTAAALAGIGANVPPRVSIRNNRFTLVDAAGVTIVRAEQTYIDTIILDANPRVSKIYYTDAFDPDDTKPPICFSDNGIGPSTECSEPQSPLCQGCEFNRWGSAISAMGSKVKACRDYKKVAVFCNLKRDMHFLLAIPPNSFANWKAYCGQLGANGLNLCEVITRISFEEEIMGTLAFEAIGWMPEKFKASYEKWLEEGKFANLIGLNDKPIEKGLAIAKPAANAGTKTLPPPKAAGKPAVASNAPEATMVVHEATPPPAAKPAARKAKPAAEPVEPVAEDDGPDLPDFLRRTSPGMEEAPEPDEAMSAALDEAFAV